MYLELRVSEDQYGTEYFTKIGENFGKLWANINISKVLPILCNVWIGIFAYFTTSFKLLSENCTNPFVGKTEQTPICQRQLFQIHLAITVTFNSDN